MQLSQKTLLDYFDAHKKSETPVGIITSLKMFAHIARARMFTKKSWFIEIWNRLIVSRMIRQLK